MRRLALIAALILLTAAQARAAENVPGSACGTAPYVTNTWQWAGGKENGGVVNGMFCNGSTWVSGINFQSTGKVGIGTTNPTSLLSVGGSGFGSALSVYASGAGNAAIQITDSTGNYLMDFIPDTGGVNFITSDYALGGPYLPLALSARENPSDLVLATTGNVGIGQTSPATKLDVNGDITNENVKSCAQLGTDSTGKLICQTPAMTLISTQTASASASLQFTNLPTTYNTLFLNCAGLLMSASGNTILFRIGEGAGPTWESGAHYTQQPDSATTGTDLFDGNAPMYAATDPLSFKAYIDNVGSSTLHKLVTVLFAERRPDLGSFLGGTEEGYWNNDTNAITGLEVVPSAGTISSGTCSLYGMN